MKYILLTILSSFYSLSAMHNPQKPAAKPKPLSIDEQGIKLDEQVKAIKQQQMDAIGIVAIAMNENLYPSSSTQSIMILRDNVPVITPEAFAQSVNENLEKKIENYIKESAEAIRRLSECHTTLMTLKERKKKGKTLTATEEMKELSAFIQTKQATLESFRKTAELQYYLDIYYEEEKNNPTKVVVQQED